MENLPKDFVPYNFALRMKRIGFDEPCFGYYLEDGMFIDTKIKKQTGNAISASTYSQAFRWFRGKKYQAEILWRGDFGDFCWKIGKFKYGSHFFSDNGFKTYEESEQACLEKLLEIVEEKQK